MSVAPQLCRCKAELATPYDWGSEACIIWYSIGTSRAHGTNVLLERRFICSRKEGGGEAFDSSQMTTLDKIHHNAGTQGAAWDRAVMDH